MTVPPVSVPNAARLERYAIRHRIKDVKPHASSLTACADELAPRPRALASARVWDVLGWCYRMTTPEIVGLLRHAGVHDDYRRVDQLTDRQLDALCHALRTPSLWKKAA